MKYRNILLVSDDDAAAEIFVSAIGAVNHKIRASVESSALKALKKLQGSKLSPDIIFLDYNMPFFDAAGYLKLVREIKTLKKIPVVLYAKARECMLREALAKFESVQFLKKRTDFRKLFDSLRQNILIP